MTFGPVDFIASEFKGNQFKGELMPALRGAGEQRHHPRHRPEVRDLTTPALDALFGELMRAIPVLEHEHDALSKQEVGGYSGARRRMEPEKIRPQRRGNELHRRSRHDADGHPAGLTSVKSPSAQGSIPNQGPAATGNSPGKGRANGPLPHYKAYVPRPLAREDRERVTVVFGGLTWKHDRLAAAALRNLGYRVELLPNPTKRDLETGKELVDTGACCPTYFTAGCLVNALRAKLAAEGRDAVAERYVFLTAGGVRIVPLRPVSRL